MKLTVFIFWRQNFLLILSSKYCGNLSTWFAHGPYKTIPKIALSFQMKCFDKTRIKEWCKKTSDARVHFTHVSDSKCLQFLRGFKKKHDLATKKKRTKYKLGLFEYQTIYGNICEELYRCTETITNTWTNSVPFWSLAEIVSIYYQIHSLRTLVASFRFISFFCIILYPFNPFAAHHSIILIKFLMKYLNHLPIFNAIHLGMEFLKPLISSFFIDGTTPISINKFL